MSLPPVYYSPVLCQVLLRLADRSAQYRFSGCTLARLSARGGTFYSSEILYRRESREFGASLNTLPTTNLRQAGRIQDDHAPVRHCEHATPSQIGQGVGDRLAGGRDHLGQLLLRQAQPNHQAALLFATELPRQDRQQVRQLDLSLVWPEALSHLPVPHQIQSQEVHHLEGHLRVRLDGPLDEHLGDLPQPARRQRLRVRMLVRPSAEGQLPDNLPGTE